MVINGYCKDCQIRRNINKYPATASADQIADYQRGVRDIIAHCEGLSGCGLNIFYLFLCKCDAFMQRFHVAQFTGVMTRECKEF
ncbi:MAG: hypothetical protein IJ654_10675 [Bacteroidales bacterium]|nr:hypothetical protein [Bacteroidales bacterium]MBR1578003.1 hypothetical protein [Bacteroidales bacterium]